MKARDRHWHSGMQHWVYPTDIDNALDAAQLAITEYYNGDRAWAEQWLLNAYAANAAKPERPTTWQEEH